MIRRYSVYIDMSFKFVESIYVLSLFWIKIFELKSFDNCYVYVFISEVIDNLSGYNIIILYMYKNKVFFLFIK